MNRLLTGLFSSALLLCSTATMAQIVVTPADTEAWVNRTSNTGTLGLGIADNNGGTSSLLMSTDASAGQIIKAARIPLPPQLAVTIGGITSISWEFYTDNATSYPRPQLEYYRLAPPSLSGTLVYESNNLSPALDTWVSASVNLGSDIFRDSRTGTTGTLASFQAGELGGVLMNFFQFGYGSTSGAIGAVTAYLDYPELNGSTWDFEEVLVLPPEPTPPPAAGPTSVPTMSAYGLALTMLGLLLVAGRRLQVSAKRK